jgi:hypothetical protein
MYPPLETQGDVIFKQSGRNRLAGAATDKGASGEG